MESLSRIAATLWQLVENLGVLVSEVWQLGTSRALLVMWLVWWLSAVNWKKLWPALGKGAWVPLLLLCNLAALVWSRLAPTEPSGWPNFWWHLAATIGLALSALVCGWLQGLFHWAPAEINLNPPVHHGHDHGHH